MSDTNISLEVVFRGDTHRVSLPSDEPVSSLHARLEELTQVPPSAQKLLFRGKKIGASQEGVTLAQVGLRDGIKVQMLGSTAQELDALHSTESEYHKKERILRERALKPQVKLRSTGSSSTSALQYRFHKLEPLDHLPDPPTALACLSKLADDPAIRHIMQQHKFSVGLLTELAPHESPGLLGLNVGAGQVIKLRIRTDAYDGFRPYLEVRRVLCHELAHNFWSEHDDNFKELNSRLNREVAEFEAVQAHGTHYLVDVRGTYQPSSNEEGEALVHVLGGTNTPLTDSIEDRRRRILEAAISRLKKQEEELEHSCGTTKSSNIM
ncbi:WLM-domain-containing protein [Pisolithus marmoratus]|nr:WLM-domain-containing protein [Pisolithus marmoratus]